LQRTGAVVTEFTDHLKVAIYLPYSIHCSIKGTTE